MKRQATARRRPPKGIGADPARAWRALVSAASAPYAASGRFTRHFAAGKLRYDPVFRHLLAAGLIPADAGVLDIGCGRGLLASLLVACERAAQSGDWPHAWAPPPRRARYVGIELMDRDIARARSALGSRARFMRGDMRAEAFPACNVAVVLDALHYVSHAEQQAILARLRGALLPGGRLLLRVGDAAQHRAFAASQWVDRAVSRLRGQPNGPSFGRPLADWHALLQALGFDVTATPMSAGTPFANVLLVAHLGANAPHAP